MSVHRSGWSWNAGPQQWYGGNPKHSRRRPKGPLRPVNRFPPPSASKLFGVGRHRGSAWVRQFSPPRVPPGHAVFRCSGSTRGSSRRQESSDRPVRPRPRIRVATNRSGCSHRFTGRLFPCNVCHTVGVPWHRLTHRLPYARVKRMFVKALLCRPDFKEIIDLKALKFNFKLSSLTLNFKL